MAGRSSTTGAEEERGGHLDLKAATTKLKVGLRLNNRESVEPKEREGVKVTVRVRPFIKEEYDRCPKGEKPSLCIGMPSKTQVEINDGRMKPVSYHFDRCYWSHDKDHPQFGHLFADQTTLYEELGCKLLEQAISGFNTCIFAYGQTGSGKSFSVLGSSGEGRGLLPRIVEGLFEYFESDKGLRCSCHVSFMEIYNEQIRDLLSAKEEKEELKVRLHPVLGAQVVGLTDAAVASKDEVMQLIDFGTGNRTVGATAMNYGSSRSHCIFSFKTSVTDLEGTAKMSQTHLVDLAGSERAGKTKAEGARLKEGANINQSLSILARVISTLAENAAKKGKKSAPPFRDSKLTYVLKDSLCGNSKTCMMTAISPALENFEETVSTLKFAQSVKKVQLSASANEANTLSAAQTEQVLRAEIERMREELEGAQKIHEMDLMRFEEMQRRFEEQKAINKKMGLTFQDDLQTTRQESQRRNTLTKDDIAKIVKARASWTKEEGVRKSIIEDSDTNSDSEATGSTQAQNAINEENLSTSRSSESRPVKAAVTVLESDSESNQGTPAEEAIEKKKAEAVAAAREELEHKLAARDALLEERTKEADCARAEVEDLKRQLQAQESDKEQAKRIAAAKEESFEKQSAEAVAAARAVLENELAAKDVLLKERIKEADCARAEVEELNRQLQAQVDDLRKQVQAQAAAKEESDAAAATCIALERELAARDALLEERNKVAEGARTEAEDLKKKLQAQAEKTTAVEASCQEQASKDARIAALEADLANTRQEQASKDARIAALEADLANTRQEQASKDARIAALEADLANTRQALQRAEAGFEAAKARVMAIQSAQQARPSGCDNLCGLFRPRPLEEEPFDVDFRPKADFQLAGASSSNAVRAA